MPRQKLIIICGPTASGKTALAVSVAHRFGGEVVSADSMQLYRGMDIGTAKPTAEEMGGIPHQMIDCAEVGEEVGAAQYRDRARACITEIAARGRLPILCGGTGLFISATVYPLDFSDAAADAGLRAELAEFARLHGNEALHKKLREADPQAAELIHPNNLKRVIRALEKAAQGAPGSPADAPQLFNGDALYDAVWVGLTMDREALYRRINARVDEMMRQGLLEEVRSLAAQYSREATAFQALGYKELLAAIDGHISLAQAVEQIKTGSRNYAKRQLTWFRREKAIRWFDVLAYPAKEELETAVFGYMQPNLHSSSYTD